MKLVLAVIHDEDAHHLMEKLTQKGFMATKLASTGGFLKTGNTTLFIGVPKEDVEAVLEIIKDICKTCKKMSMINPPISNIPDNMISYPIEVTVGGATIFVVDIDQYLKI
jgi:uncharacterized protein YaaQ